MAVDSSGRAVAVHWYVHRGRHGIGDWFKDALFVLPEHNTLARLNSMAPGPSSPTVSSDCRPVGSFGGSGSLHLLHEEAGAGCGLEEALRERGYLPDTGQKKYGFDETYQALFAGGSRGIGNLLWSMGDKGLIDGLIINGSARSIGRFAGWVRNIQTGYLFHYAIAMILGLLVLLTWFVIA